MDGSFQKHFLRCPPLHLSCCLSPYIRQRSGQFRLVFSDEYDYFAEVTNLAKYGLHTANAGYFGYSFDTHALIGNYGGHGVWSLIPYLPFALIFGWAPASIVLVHTAYLALGLVFTYQLSRSFWKTLLCAVTVFLSVTVMIYQLSGFLEVMMVNFSLVLAALLTSMLYRDSSQKKLLSIYLIIVVIAGLVRLTNLAFLIPGFIIEVIELKRNFWKSLLKYALISFAVAFLIVLFTSPYPWGFLSQLAKASEKITFFMVHAKRNSLNMFRLTEQTPLEVILRYSLMAWMVLQAFLAIASRGEKDNRSLMLHTSVTAVLFFILVAIYAFYEVNIERPFISILLFAMFSFILKPNKPRTNRVAWVFLGLTLLVANVQMLSNTEYVLSQFILRHFEASGMKLAERPIVYDPNAAHRWDNTVYVDYLNYGWFIEDHYQAGLGTMIIDDNDIKAIKNSSPQLKAKYLVSEHLDSVPGYELFASQERMRFFKRTLP